MTRPMKQVKRDYSESQTRIYHVCICIAHRELCTHGFSSLIPYCIVHLSLSAQAYEYRLGTLSQEYTNSKGIRFIS